MDGKDEKGRAGMAWCRSLPRNWHYFFLGPPTPYPGLREPALSPFPLTPNTPEASFQCLAPTLQRRGGVLGPGALAAVPILWIPWGRSGVPGSVGAHSFHPFAHLFTHPLPHISM